MAVLVGLWVAGNCVALARVVQPGMSRHLVGSKQFLEDFGTLAAITATTDAIWFSSAYAVSDELRAGILRELPQAVGAEVRVVMYTLARRSQSFMAKAFKQAFRRHVGKLAQASA
jgi:DNA-binding transcriptional LysR family regulator